MCPTLSGAIAVGQGDLHDPFCLRARRACCCRWRCSPRLASCGVNSIPTKEEAAKASWAQVENQYQRRSDLIPNLVATVKAAGKQEQETLTQVIEARAKATSVNIDASQLNDPAAVEKFQAAQGELSGALSRLLVSIEKYPDLKTNENFLTLQSQLEGTENRITVARQDYNTSVQAYNTEIRTFPALIAAKTIYGAKPLVPFKATTANAEVAPTVKF